MLENRPIVAITFGYIIGIITGLYCKISIVFLYFIFYVLYIICKRPKEPQFKLISLKRYSRYFKIIITKKVIKIILVTSIISNFVILLGNYNYSKVYNNYNNKEILIKGEIVSNVSTKKYRNVYKLKILSQEKYLYKKNVMINTKKDLNLNYGDIISLKGVFTKPKQATNFNCFDYSKYLKSIGICGTIELKNYTKIGENNRNIKK